MKVLTMKEWDIDASTHQPIFFNIIPECRPGFYGLNCLQTCGENFYGNLCENKCDCNETQICHHACGCLQKVDASKNDSSMSENLKVSYYAASCPTSFDAIVKSQGTIYCYIIFIF